MRNRYPLISFSDPNYKASSFRKLDEEFFKDLYGDRSKEFNEELRAFSDAGWNMSRYRSGQTINWFAQKNNIILALAGGGWSQQYATDVNLQTGEYTKHKV